MSKNILIIAAEDSSAHYAEQLMDQLMGKSMGKSMGKLLEKAFDMPLDKPLGDLSVTHIESLDMIQFWGVGSKAMVEKGFTALAYPSEMAVVGLFEVLKHYRYLRSIFYKIIDQAKLSPPDLVILMDYPGFNLRLASELKKINSNCKIVYWIPPQLWAWKSHRVKTIKKYLDHVIVVFPFEIDFFKKHDVTVEYFGHPLADEIINNRQTDEDLKLERLRVGISTNKKVIGLMPGSRKSEIEQHFSVQLETAEKLFAQNENFIFLVPVAPSIDIDFIKSFLQNSSVPLIIQKTDSIKVIRLMDVVLVASGTATLIVALLKKPMVIMYKVKPLTAWLLKRLVKGVSFFGLPNIVLQKAIVTERFQEAAQPEPLCQDVLELINSEEVYSKVTSHLDQIEEKLLGPQAIKKTAQFIKQLL